MADKAIVDKAISDLTQALQITGEDLFVLEQSGEAKKLKGSQVVQYAKDSVAAEVQGVKEYADNAKASADAAAKDATRAETAAQGIDDKVAAADASAKAAETAKTDAQAARDAIVNMIVEAVTLETGTPATVSKSLVDNVYKLAFGLPRGNTGAPGPQGATGNGILGIALKSGNHAPGTSDVYTITLTDGTTFDFAVYNGANGADTGDMLASVYDPQGKRTDIYKYVDDLDSGVVHKTGDEDINGVKTFVAPSNISGSDQITSKFKTSNGGSVSIGKEGSNGGTMLRFDQADGTARLRFRASAAAGAMIWEQPEQGAKLYIDLGKKDVDYHRITFPTSGYGTLAFQSSVDDKVPKSRKINGHALSANIDLTASDVGALPDTTAIPSVPITTAILKGDGSGGLAAAVAELDYASPVKLYKVTLTVAGWNSNTKQQTVACAGVLADNTKQKVFCSAVDESYDSAWNTCYVQCAGHAADSLTFQCDEIPTVAVEVFVSVQPVSFVS